MVNKLFGKFKHEIFNNHFIKYYIDKRADAEAFEIYYQYRVGAVATSALLGCDLATDGDKITANDPKTGKSCDMTFLFSQKYDTDQAGEFFQKDSDSMLEFADFTADLLKDKLNLSTKPECLEDTQCTLMNYLLENGFGDQFEIEKMRNLFVSASDEIEHARLATPSVDMDIILASASDLLIGIEGILINGLKYNREVTINQIIKEEHKALAMQMDIGLEARDCTRSNIASASRKEKDVSFWEYKAMMNRIANCPEMW